MSSGSIEAPACSPPGSFYFPKDMADAAFKAASEMYVELSAKNAKWQKIYGSFSKFRDDAILWSRFSDGAFDNYMASTLGRKS